MPLRTSAILCLLGLLLLGGGCSMMRTSYNHLDTVASWMAHDYFDLDSQQRDAFTQRFNRLHAWHRQEQLPEYAQFLGDIQQRVKRGLQAEDMLWIIDGFKQRYARVAARGAADAADLLATLSDQQVDAFRQQLDKANQKFLKEHRSNDSEAARQQAAERRTLSQLRDWLGPLSNAQEERIKVLQQQVPLTDKLRHQDRLHRQQEFLVLLKSRHGNRQAFAKQLRDWLENWESGRAPEQKRLFDESWKKRAEFYAAVDRMLTVEQRNHLLNRLQDFIDDFRALTERRTSSAATAG